MPSCLDVIIPGPWWNSLTYTCDAKPVEGVRVTVPMGRHNALRVGFVAGAAPFTAVQKGLKAVKEVLDKAPVFDCTLWLLAKWLGQSFLCGTGEALQLMSPAQLLKGEVVAPLAGVSLPTHVFEEQSFYHPLEQVRFECYREEMLSCTGRVLVLFPEIAVAKNFYQKLPETLKNESVLWPSTGGKKLWQTWLDVRSEKFRFVIGPLSAVFAPADFELIIVEDESNPAYIFMRPPRVSARSIAGQRAKLSGAKLLLGGRMPSAKTFLRSSPKCKVLPDEADFVVVDMARSLKNQLRGIEGELPVTRSLLERTKNTLNEGRSALWIMDRKGTAGEVLCSECGEGLTCPRCSAALRSEQNGSLLHCSRCRFTMPLPDRCPSCKGMLFVGKRPGLESLLPVANRYLREYNVILSAAEAPLLKAGNKALSLVLGTRRILTLCDHINVGLVAWLDIDAEAGKIEHGSRFQTFSMVWESYWRGRTSVDLESSDARAVLIQSRRSGTVWRKMFCSGWEDFWRVELGERKKLELPPYKLLVQIDLPAGEDRAVLCEELEKAGLLVMDSGEASSPFWVSVNSSEQLRAALAKRFEIRRSKEKFPVVTVWAE